MRPSASRQERRRPRRGAAMVEMAVILPAFALIVFGMLEATRMCMVAQLLTDAARQGCRVAVTNGKTSADVTASVDAALDAAKIKRTLVGRALSPSSIETTTSSDQISLTLSVNFGDVNWLGAPFFFKTGKVTAGATMLSQRP